MRNSDKADSLSDSKATDNKHSSVGSIKTSHARNLKDHLRPPRITLGGIIVVIAVIVVAIFIYNWLRHRNDNACTTGSNAVVLKEAVAAFDTNDTIPEQQLVTKIESFKNYQKDPSCMYIVTASAVLNQQLPQAQSALNQFNKVSGNKAVSPILLKYESVDTLKMSVTNLQKVIRDANGHTILMKPVTVQQLNQIK